MNNILQADNALHELKQALAKIEKTYVSHYLKEKLRSLVKEIESEIDLTDNIFTDNISVD